MRSFTTVATLSVLAGALAQSAPMINTPAALVECQPTQLTFSGGSAPYFLSVLPAGQVSATPLEQLPEQSAAGSYTWTVNLAAGTNITLSIRDGSGALNYASPVVIQAGTSTDCLNAAATSAAASAGVTGVASASSASSTIAVSSAASSTLITSAASATVTAAGGAPTSLPSNETSSSYNFTCSSGDLIYGITVAELQNVTLARAVSYFGNWSATVTGPLVNTTGSGVGATRAYNLTQNITIDETLRLNQTNMTTMSLHQQWNSTKSMAEALSTNLTLYSSFDDLTVYTNTTTNATSLQYFILGCFSNQAEGLTVLAQYIDETVSYWAGQLSGANRTTTAARTKRNTVKLF